MIVEVSDGLSAGLIANGWRISVLLSPVNDGDDGLLCFGWGIHVSEDCRVACKEEEEGQGYWWGVTRLRQDTSIYG